MNDNANPKRDDNLDASEQLPLPSLDDSRTGEADGSDLPLPSALASVSLSRLENDLSSIERRAGQPIPQRAIDRERQETPDPGSRTTTGEQAPDRSEKKIDELIRALDTKNNAAIDDKLDAILRAILELKGSQASSEQGRSSDKDTDSRDTDQPRRTLYGLPPARRVDKNKKDDEDEPPHALDAIPQGKDAKKHHPDRLPANEIAAIEEQNAAVMRGMAAFEEANPNAGFDEKAAERRRLRDQNPKVVRPLPEKVVVPEPQKPNAEQKQEVANRREEEQAFVDRGIQKFEKEFPEALPIEKRWKRAELRDAFENQEKPQQQGQQPQPEAPKAVEKKVEPLPEPKGTEKPQQQDAGEKKVASAAPKLSEPELDAKPAEKLTGNMLEAAIASMAIGDVKGTPTLGNVKQVAPGVFEAPSKDDWSAFGQKAPGLVPSMRPAGGPDPILGVVPPAPEPGLARPQTLQATAAETAQAPKQVSIETRPPESQTSSQREDRRQQDQQQDTSKDSGIQQNILRRVEEMSVKLSTLQTLSDKTYNLLTDVSRKVDNNSSTARLG